MFWPEPTHPPTHQTIHPPMGGEVSTDFKSSNGNEISWLVQVLLTFDWFQGPPGGWGWVDVGVGWWVGAPPTCAQAHACMHVHVRTRTYDIIGNSQGYPQWGRPFAWNYHVYHACMWVHVCAYVRVRVHVCGGTPQPPPPPYTHPPTPRAAGSPKHQNSISLELIKIIQFCLKIFLPLNIP